MKRSWIVLTFLALCFGLFLPAQSLPLEPEIELSPIPLPDSFPAGKYKIKTLKCYSNNKLFYKAEYDNNGRIFRLEDYLHMSSRPNLVTWSYAAGTIQKKMIVGYCPTCTTATIITERWSDKGSNSSYIHVITKYFEKSILKDSLSTSWRIDGQLLDSAFFRDNILLFRDTRKYHPNGTVSSINRIDNRANVDYLEEVNNYDYDTLGNILRHGQSKGGKLIYTKKYIYNSWGKRTTFEQTDANGSLVYSEKIIYNSIGFPEQRLVADIAAGDSFHLVEYWKYDSQGRYTWNAHVNDSPFIKDSSYLYVRFFSIKGNDRVELKVAGNNLTRKEIRTNGSIVTIINSRHPHSGPQLPRPTIQMENDPLFRNETIEEHDTALHTVKRISFERDWEKPNAKISEQLYQYDSLGKLIIKEDWDFKSAPSKHFVLSYAYNGNSQVISTILKEDSEGKVAYSTRTYNEKGQLLELDSCRMKYCVNDSFTYDSLGRMTMAVHRSKRGTVLKSNFQYSCDDLAVVIEDRGLGFVQRRKVSYLPSCLPSSYLLKRTDGTIFLDLRWEYEFFQQ